MKRTVAILGLSLVCLHAQAACGPNDFAVEDFDVAIPRSGAMKRFSLKGKLINRCAEPAAAQIRVIAKDANGRELKAEEGWPAGSNNIPPGQGVTFNFGPLFRYDPAIEQFTIVLIEIKAW